MRARKSEHPKKEAAKVEEKKEEESSSSNINELMMAEEDKGDVGFQLYKSFAKYNRGYGFMFCIFLVQILWMGSNAFSNLWLARWSERNQKYENGQNVPENDYYL